MTGKNFIGFDLSAQGKKQFYTSNPATGESLGVNFIEATEDELNLAVQKAKIAYTEYGKIPLLKRAEFLHTIADEIELAGDNLLDVYCEESGLSRSRAELERSRTILQLHSFANEIVKGDWMNASIDTPELNSPIPKPDIRKFNIGIGPVVVFGASNFPLAYSTAGGDTASALAAGCPVIVKSHSMHAGTGELVSTAIIKAAKKTGMPDGVFSNLNSIGFEVGRKLVQHRDVKAVGFTGSLAGGRALFDLANDRPEPIPVFAEMGSVNPVIILKSAINDNPDKLAEDLSNSLTSAAGQFCTNPGLIFIEEDIHLEDFIAMLAERIVSKESDVMLHTSIYQKFEEGKSKAVKNTQGSIIEKEGNLGLNEGRQAILIVQAEEFQNNPNLHNEVFGPFSVVVRFKNMLNLQDCLNKLGGQLTCSIFGSEKEIKSHLELIDMMGNKCGRIIINGVPTGVRVCPSMNHGGSYPATTDSRFTAVGIDAMKRFLRPLSFQNFTNELLPDALKNENPLKINRRINGEYSFAEINFDFN